MVDLIGISWGSTLTNPIWTELARKESLRRGREVPADVTREKTVPMLQSLLAERFRLTAHKDTKPLPIYELTAGEKSLVKEAGGTGCRPEADSTAGPGNGACMLMMSEPDGKTTQIAPGPNSLIRQ